MSSISGYLDCASMAGIGVSVSKTVDGFRHLGEGRLEKGAKDILFGTVCSNLGSLGQELNLRVRSEMMKGTLEIGAATLGVQGALRLRNGVKQKDRAEILRGGLQTAIGAGATALIESLDAKTLLVAQQAATLALPSAYIAKLGFIDAVKGRYRSAFGKIMLGLGGIAAAGYYVYSSLFADKSHFSPDQLSFLQDHKGEIEHLVEHKKPIGAWRELGSGASKKAFVHPDLDAMVLKVPGAQTGFRTETGDDDLRWHYNNLEEIRDTARSFDRIVLPESHLYPTTKGLALLEQKFEFSGFSDVPLGRQKIDALKQFKEFEMATGICDVIPRLDINAGLLKGSSPVKIGIIDFDCNHWNYLGSFKKIVASGVVGLCGAVSVGKKITETVPKNVLKTGAAVALGVSIGLAPIPTAIAVGAIAGGILAKMGVKKVAAATADFAARSCERAYDWIASSRTLQEFSP